jgi:hypothetical protein
VLLVHRGTCTFGTKAKNAQKTNATGIIIINNEPGLDHLPGPDAHDIQFSVSSIAQLEGLLLEAVYDEGPSQGNGFGRKLEGYVVPINCENAGASCVPATFQERRQAAGLIEGTFASAVYGSGLVMCCAFIATRLLSVSLESSKSDLCSHSSLLDIGGTINIVGKSSLPASDLPMEYLLAHFGTKVR